MFSGAQRQSRTALVAVILFLVFDFAALALNFWLSWKIEEQAVAINLAGRQRMLSQRMAKVLLQLEDTQSKGVDSGHLGGDPAPLLKELQLTFDLFDNTLKGFAEGNNTHGGDGELVFLRPVSGKQAKAVVNEALELWVPYRSLVAAILHDEGRELRQSLPAAAVYAQKHNLALLALMNTLTTTLEQLTQREAAQIRWYQSIAFLLALLNFFGAFFLYDRRIREAGKHQSLLDEIINKVSASVMVLDRHNRIIKANQTTAVLFAYPVAELIGMSLTQLLRMQDGNRIGQRKDGTTFLALTERNEAFLDGRQLFIETVSDITDQRLNEAHLSDLAYHDLLTHLPNRLLFDQLLSAEISRAQRRGSKLGVLFIDLDKFKAINDSHGHEIGDLLLQDAAVRLKTCLRESDVISRRGGDEFTAIINDVSSHDHCAKVAQVVISQLEKTFSIDGLELRVGASIGISIYPDDGNKAVDLIDHADRAMYQSKEQGRGVYSFYSSVAADSAAVGNDGVST